MGDGTIVVMGGSGFVGRHVVNRLAAGGGRIIVPTRRCDNARALCVLPTLDISVADVNDPAQLARVVRGASAVVNLVGILNETRAATFADAHVALASKVVAACKEAG